MSFVNAVARGTSLNEIYPVGSVIIKNAPWNGFPGQTWVLFGSGKTLVGQDTNDADFSSLGQTGGSKYFRKYEYFRTIVRRYVATYARTYLKIL